MVFYSYNNENGLVSNLAKSISQDNEGFIWIATDAGLSRFDGKNFTNFQSVLPSLYVKQVFNSNDNKLKVISDFGLGNFTPTANIYSYQPILNSSRKETKGNLYYPKAVFEDSKGYLWISDLNGISLLKNGSFKKYYFDEKYHADSYFRSFSVIELGKHKIFAASLNGYLFSYNEKIDKFEPIPFMLPGSKSSINALAKYSEKSFLIGTSEGLYFAEINSDRFEFKKINNIPQISSIIINKDSDIFLGTWTDGLWSGKINSISKFEPLKFRSIKNLFIDKQNNVWAASDEGVAVLKKMLFVSDLSSDEKIDEGTFIQNIMTDDEKSVYYSDENFIYKIENLNGQSVPVKIISSGRTKILSSAVGQKGIWISFRDKHFELREKNSLRLLYSGNLGNDRLNSIFVDKEGSLWAWLAKRRQILRIDPSLKMEFYDFNYDDVDFINFFKQSDDGSIYCAGYGINSFFLKFDNKTKRFINLIPEYSISRKTQVQVFDVQFKDKNTILLATSSGVLIYNSDGIKSYMMPSFFGSKITKAVLFYKDKTWIGTDKGLLYLGGNDSVYFDKQDGLPNSSIITQGIKEDSKGNLWVATANGVCHWVHNIGDITKTPDPFFSDIKINNKDIAITEQLEFLSGSSLTGSFVSLSYPSDRVLFRYRILGHDSVWSVPSELNTINLIGIPTGKYVLEVQAKNPQLYWSNVVRYNIRIVPHWYFSTLMIVLYILLLFGLSVFLVFALMHRRIRKFHEKEEHLKTLVNQKTTDLQEAIEKTERLLEKSEQTNRLLEEATEQKTYMLSIASHDLKSPLQAIIGFSDIIREETADPELKDMGEAIHSSSLDMLRQINELLDSAAIESKNVKLNRMNISLNDLVKEIIQSNKKRAYQKKQTLQLSSDVEASIYADEYWMKKAIDNIVNNAIKYSAQNALINISITRLDGYINLRVQDGGPGFTDEDLKKMFNRYQRLSARPTGGESSTGLGLSIVKDIIDIHQGKIIVKNSSDGGAEFNVQLPANPLP